MLLDDDSSSDASLSVSEGAVLGAVGPKLPWGTSGIGMPGCHLSLMAPQTFQCKCWGIKIGLVVVATPFLSVFKLPKLHPCQKEQ